MSFELNRVELNRVELGRLRQSRLGTVGQLIQRKIAKDSACHTGWGCSARVRPVTAIKAMSSPRLPFERKKYTPILPAPEQTGRGDEKGPVQPGGGLPPKRQKRAGRFACDACRSKKSAVWPFCSSLALLLLAGLLRPHALACLARYVVTPDMRWDWPLCMVVHNNYIHTYPGRAPLPAYTLHPQPRNMGANTKRTTVVVCLLRQQAGQPSSQSVISVPGVAVCHAVQGYPSCSSQAA